MPTAGATKDLGLLSWDPALVRQVLGVALKAILDHYDNLGRAPG